MSLLLPCNVVLETVDGGTRVAIAYPRELMAGELLAELGDEATARLDAVIDTVDVN